MAVVEQELKKRSWIEVNTGTTQEPKYVKRYMGSGYKISTTATDQEIYTAASAFADLQTHNLESIMLEEAKTLVNQA